jgi:hypothetical protein
MHITKNYIKKIVKSHQNINSQKFIKIKTAFKIRNALKNYKNITNIIVLLDNYGKFMIYIKIIQNQMHIIDICYYAQL